MWQWLTLEREDKPEKKDPSAMWFRRWIMNLLAILAVGSWLLFLATFLI